MDFQFVVQWLYSNCIPSREASARYPSLLVICEEPQYVLEQISRLLKGTELTLKKVRTAAEIADTPATGLVCVLQELEVVFPATGELPSAEEMASLVALLRRKDVKRVCAPLLALVSATGRLHPLLRRVFRDEVRVMHTREDDLREVRRVQAAASEEQTSAAVQWRNVGGQWAVKARLEEALRLLLGRGPDLYRALSPVRGLLLFGAPGTGKTLLVRELVSAAGLPLLALPLGELLAGELGQSERRLRRLFDEAERRRPCVVFLDEFEALFGAREALGPHARKLISQLLLLLDSQRPGVLVVAASNSPEMIDAAFFRAGRLDACLLVDVPRSDQERLEVLRALTARMRLAPDADLPALAAATDGFTGADLAQLCARAGLAALQENVDAQEVAQRHLSAALAALCPSAPPSLLRRYRAWRPNRSGHQEEAYPDPTPAHSATGAADPSEVFGTRTVNRNALVIHF